MLANVNLNTDLQLLRSNVGRVIVVGNRGTVDINPRLMMGKETSVCGVTLFASTDVKSIDLNENSICFIIQFVFLFSERISNDECLFTTRIETWLHKTFDE